LTVRLFVGVELEDPLRAACAAAARDLEQRLRRARASLVVRWIPEQNLHITLWFIGHVDDAKAAAIRDSLCAAWEVTAFAIAIDGAGAFPPKGPPSTLWLGVTTGADRLTDLYRELEVRFAALGYEPERRPYHPHITIGRVKHAARAVSRQARAVLQSAGVKTGSGHVRSLTLFESRLGSGGARYDPLLRVPLKG
jgi:2'-5' RNA ligase